jgi:hypothetical protein
LIVAALFAMGSTCQPDPPAGVTPPAIQITVNGIPDDMNDLLVLPPSGFVVNISWQQGTYPVNPALLSMFARRWGSESGSQVVFDLPLVSGGGGAAGILSTPLEPGTHTLRATLGDASGRIYYAEYAVAVRNFASAPPIGSGQQFWLDFESDRNAEPGPDFPIDLRAFGLGSAAAPLVSGWVLDEVTQRVVERVENAYHTQTSSGLPGADPVAVDIVSSDPGAGDVTRVCIGGEDPSGGVTIGSILTDPGNGNRNSVECATLPPTGIFPSELLILAGDPTFQSTFDGLRAATGGIPVGESPHDATVLEPGFDPGSALPAQLARYDQVQNAIQIFADLLGSVVAHEAAHALGLVPSGPPGGGLYGGTGGPELTHDVTPAGVSPSENFLMNAGNTFTFSKLAGLNGQPLPYFRPLDYAYLRDRVVIDSAVTLLANPPTLASISPATINPSGYTQVFFNGSGYLPTPVIRLLSASYTYNVTGELLLTSSQLQGWGNYGQILPGLYDVELKNPDGQRVVLPQALTVPTAP